MNRSDQDIDKLFKNALKEQVIPPFEDAFFDEILPQLPKRKRKLGFWWLGGIIVCLVAGVALFLNNSNSLQKIETKKLSLSTKQSRTKNAVEDKTGNNQSITPQNQTNKVHKSSISHMSSDNDVNRNNSQKEKAEHLTNNEFISTPIDSPKKSEQLPAAKVNAKEIEIEHNPLKLQSEAHISRLTPLEITLNNQNDSISNTLIALPFAHNLNQSFQFKLGIGEMQTLVESNTISPTKSIQFGTYSVWFKNNYTLRTGLSYQTLLPSELNLNRYSKVYGFSSDEYFQTIQYKAIHVAQAELYLGKTWGRHQMEFGAGFGRVLGASVYTETKQNKSMTQQGMIHGVNFGLNKWTIQTTATYSMAISKHVSIGADFTAHFNSILLPNTFNNPIRKTPIQVQFTTRFTL